MLVGRPTLAGDVAVAGRLIANFVTEISTCYRVLIECCLGDRQLAGDVAVAGRLTGNFVTVISTCYGELIECWSGDQHWRPLQVA